MDFDKPDFEQIRFSEDALVTMYASMLMIVRIWSPDAVLKDWLDNRILVEIKKVGNFYRTMSINFDGTISEYKLSKSDNPLIVFNRYHNFYFDDRKELYQTYNEVWGIVAKDVYEKVEREG